MALLSNVFTSMQCPVPSRCSRTRRIPIAACMLDHRVGFARNSFPPDFKFGSAGSSFQVEGAINEGGRGPIWDSFTHLPEKIQDWSNAEIAKDSYYLYMEDIKVIKAMGLDSYRFSISWPTILPRGTKKGGINAEGVNYYNNLIDTLIENGIQPFVTLFHWDLPLELESKHGGFRRREIIEDFKDFANVCFHEFGDRVKHWITMNEPNIFTLDAYDKGIFPPARCSGNYDFGDSTREPYIVTHNLILCHAAVVDLYRTNYQAIQNGEIGITLAATWVKPYSSGNPDQQAAQRAMDFIFGWYLEPIVFGDYPFIMRAIVRERLPTFTEEESKLIKRSYDFIGLNYYYANYAKSLTLNFYDKPVSYTQDSYTEQTSNLSLSLIARKEDNIPIGIAQKSLAQEKEDKQEKEDEVEEEDKQYVYPRGIKELLLYVKNRYRNPTIYIIENGFGMNHAQLENSKVKEEDLTRQELYADHLWELQETLRMGANVKGFFAWSLMYSFEWSLRYGQRIGLCCIDHEKPSLDQFLKQLTKWLSMTQWLAKFFAALILKSLHSTNSLSN